MTLDNARQKELLLELMNKASFGGAILEEVYELKLAIKNASIDEDKAEE